MADAKISDLTEKVTPLVDDDLLVIVDSEVGPITTKKIKKSNAFSDVILNTTHRLSDGKDHSDVVLNNSHRAATGNPHSATTTDIPQGTNRYYNPSWLQYSNAALQTTATNVDINFATDQNSFPNGKLTKATATQFRTDFIGHIEIHVSVSVFSGTNNSGYALQMKKNTVLQPFTERREITRAINAEHGAISATFVFNCAVNDTFSFNLASIEGATLSLNPDRASVIVKVLKET